MKDIKIIVGANFGDEGKGHMTNYFASQVSDGIVVRFNGGAQAGHTVKTADKEHIFSHFGSGTLSGLPTYLSSFFIVNPMLFMKEYKVLESKIRWMPRIYMDFNCLITTPYDMLINQISEEHRNSGRHGSCGVGINETIERSQYKEFRITMFDIWFHQDWVKMVLKFIHDKYVPKRLSELGINNIPDKFKTLLDSNNIIENYLEDVKNMIYYSLISDIYQITNYQTIIFEGAQGLLLDQNYIKYFPHLTRSNTGCQNAVTIIKTLGLEYHNIEVIYVTRSYMTRHGAGPFPTETLGPPFSNIVDTTNIPNTFQGELRYGLMDGKELLERVFDDLQNFPKNMKIAFSLAITCLDQTENKIKVLEDNKVTEYSVTDYHKKFIEDTDIYKLYLSYGSSTSDVKLFLRSAYDFAYQLLSGRKIK
jgi:adenylosuccinate synthase